MPETFTVPVICSWCQKPTGTKAGFTEDSPTHGMCPECEAKHFPTPLPGEHKSFSLNDEMAYSEFPGGGVSDWSYGEQGEQYI